MRIIQISDVHLDERRQLAGALRLTADGESEALVRTTQCVDHVISAALSLGPVDLWAITGDLFDAPTPTQHEVRAAVRLVYCMADQAPVVVLAGNHDAPMAGAGATALEGLKLRKRVHVVEQPEVLRIAGASVVCLPYPRRAELVALAPEGSREERNAAASQALQSMLTVLRDSDYGAPKVCLYHGTITGSVVGAQPRTLSGDVELHAGAFAGFDVSLAGHIHKRQQFTSRVHYAGSIDRVDFDEEHDTKCALDVRLYANGDVTVTEIPTPARRYVTLPAAPDADWQWEPSVVYRVKARVSAAEAVAVRGRVSELSGAGCWITAALDVADEARVRDEAARPDESPAAMLARWVASNPQHTAEVAAAHNAELAAVNNDVERLHAALAGA